LLSHAQEFKRRKEKEFTELQKDLIIQNEAKITMQIAQTGQIPTSSELSAMVKQGTMTSDFAQSVMKAVTSPAMVNADTDNTEFSNLTVEIFKSADDKVQQKTIESILKGGGDGKLSKEDMTVLIQSAQMSKGQKRSEAVASIETLGKWADKTKGVIKADVFRGFMSKIQEGKTPQVAVNETMNENVVKAIPSVLSIPPTGKIMVDKNGNRAKVFPDGHIEEIK
jgi:hypothetical protein